MSSFPRLRAEGSDVPKKACYLLGIPHSGPLQMIRQRLEVLASTELKHNFADSSLRGERILELHEKIAVLLPRRLSLPKRI